MFHSSCQVVLVPQLARLQSQNPPSTGCLICSPQYTLSTTAAPAPGSLAQAERTLHFVE